MALGRTVDELLDSISYDELLQWGEYYSVEPFGEWPANVRAAQHASIVANINRDPKKRTEPFTLKDFMLFEPSRSAPKEDGAKIDPTLVQWLFMKANREAKG